MHAIFMVADVDTNRQPRSVEPALHSGSSDARLRIFLQAHRLCNDGGKDFAEKKLLITLRVYSTMRVHTDTVSLQQQVMATELP